MSDIVKLKPDEQAKPLPSKYGYPSDFGLANAITSLIRDYGPVMAVNRLIEEAENLRDGKDHMVAVYRTRIEP